MLTIQEKQRQGDTYPKKINEGNKSRKGAAAYQLGNTSSRTITEVKQR